MTASERQRATALQAASLLLAYPDEELLERLPLVRAAVQSLPPRVSEPLGRFADHLAHTPHARLAADYVDTFDLRRRCCLYLTYYSHGDTRKRGMALLEFTATYRRAGMELSPGELPDHLAVVLEFAAANPEEGFRLLGRHRAAIELLRLALAEAGSPYADLIDAIRAVLPEAPPRDIDEALRLAREGPPAEEVGLEPFAPPEYMGGRR